MPVQKSRPLTVREIQEQKKQKRESDKNKVRIRNITRLQPVPIQLYGKDSKDAVNQITIQIGPGKSVDLPEYRLMAGQLSNLRKRKLISVTKTGSSSSSGYRQFLPDTIKKRSKIDLSKSFKNKSVKVSKSGKSAKSKANDVNSKSAE